MNMIRGMKYSFLGLWENPKKKRFPKFRGEVKMGTLSSEILMGIKFDLA
jgi:hypothetical protein